jgi:hypothetical protein
MQECQALPLNVVLKDVRLNEHLPVRGQYMRFNYADARLGKKSKFLSAMALRL